MEIPGLLTSPTTLGVIQVAAIVAAWWALRGEIRQDRQETRQDIGDLRAEVMGVRERVARIEAKLDLRT